MIGIVRSLTCGEYPHFKIMVSITALNLVCSLIVRDNEKVTNKTKFP